MTPYIVHIPTRGKDRLPVLEECIDAFSRQTHPPQRIVVVDNNDVPGLLLPHSPGNVIMVENKYDTPGIIQGDATGMEYAVEFGYEVAARWDDDLIPDPHCMERLIKLFDDQEVVAAGGMYPATGNAHPIFGHGKFSRRMADGAILSGNDNNRHVQFFPWWGPHETIRRHFLYSSFAYRVGVALDVGGFCTDFSQHSYRADTDFTLRMGQRGKLLLRTDAVAEHRLCAGGTRGIGGEAKQAMLQADAALFVERMKQMGIPYDYEREGVIDTKEADA